MLVNKLTLILLYQIITTIKCNTIKENEINKLEKEKKELFKQLNNAIDDSIVVLKRNNSVFPSGIEHMKELKDRIKEIDNAGNSQEVDEIYEEGADNNTEVRRSIMSKKHKLKETLFHMIIGGKKKLEKMEHADRIENRLKLEEKLEEWLQQRREEKRKVKEYKLKVLGIHTEVCPRNGTKNKRKGKSKKTKVTYPCCRKCCKSSYLGCL